MVGMGSVRNVRARVSLFRKREEGGKKEGGKHRCRKEGSEEGRKAGPEARTKVIPHLQAKM
jgi:hypothetical protein